jgi:hypothetical protein
MSVAPLLVLDVFFIQSVSLYSSWLGIIACPGMKTAWVGVSRQAHSATCLYSLVGTTRELGDP